MPDGGLRIQRQIRDPEESVTEMRRRQHEQAGSFHSIGDLVCT